MPSGETARRPESNGGLTVRYRSHASRRGVEHVDGNLCTGQPGLNEAADRVPVVAAAARAEVDAGVGDGEAERLHAGHELTRRPSAAPAVIFSTRRPPLINPPGITHLAGIASPPPFFNEQMPLRDGVPLHVRLTDGSEREVRSPVINTIPGAMDIQQWFDRAAWAAQAYNPVAYSMHLRRKPLPGVPVRPVLLQLAFGDQASHNPDNATILRASGLADRTTLFRNDLAIAEHPKMPRNPHGFMANGNLIDQGDPFVLAIMRGAQEQIAEFFASDGARVIHPEPRRFFEVPIAEPHRLEALNYAR